MLMSVYLGLFFMCVCVYVCVFMCVHVCMFVCVYVYVFACPCVICRFNNMFMCECVYVCVCSCLFVGAFMFYVFMFYVCAITRILYIVRAGHRTKRCRRRCRGCAREAKTPAQRKAQPRGATLRPHPVEELQGSRRIRREHIYYSIVK